MYKQLLVSGMLVGHPFADFKARASASGTIMTFHNSTRSAATPPTLSETTVSQAKREAEKVCASGENYVYALMYNRMYILSAKGKNGKHFSSLACFLVVLLRRQFDPTPRRHAESLPES